MDILRMEHIKKSFDGLEVLKDISLSVKEGDVLAIIGPSGSGKSTIMRCAVMLETIDSGEIEYVGGRAAWTDETGAVVARFARQHMAPGEMEHIALPRVLLEKAGGDTLTVSCEEVSE